jgi:hypothetical protein
MKHLAPVVKDRQKYIDEYGKDWDDRPVCPTLDILRPMFEQGYQKDVLSWVMDYASGDEKSLRNFTLRVLLLNLVAVHSTTAVPIFFLLACL